MALPENTYKYRNQINNIGQKIENIIEETKIEKLAVIKNIVHLADSNKLKDMSIEMTNVPYSNRYSLLISNVS